MALYEADVWLGSNSGYQTVEISSSSINGVSEQIQNIYKVNKEQIRNIRKVQIKNKDVTITGSDESVSLLFVIVIILFILSPSIFLMVLFGSSGGLIFNVIIKKFFSEISKIHVKKFFTSIIIISLCCGGFGFYVGHKIENDTTPKTR